MHPLVDRDDDNDFTGALAGSLREVGVTVDGFAWRRAFTLQFDVLHVHWPEALVRGGGPVRSHVKALAFATLIVVTRVFRRKRVATVHNLKPHESTSRFQSAVIRMWYRAAEDRAYFTRDAVRRAIVGPGHYVPHQAYSVGTADGDLWPVRGALITFGFVRRYKRLEAAIDGVAAIPDLRLSIVGMPVPETYGNEIVSRARPFSNIHVELGSVPFGELVQRIRRSEFVLLPYEDLYSSGAAILALSVGRPVMLVESPATREMEMEFGSEWVGVLPVDWTPADLNRVVQGWRQSTRPCGPNLSGRTVDHVARLYQRMYEPAPRPGARRPADASR